MGDIFKLYRQEVQVQPSVYVDHAPHECRELFAKTFRIGRYVDETYPEALYEDESKAPRDTVGLHIYRCILIARMLELGLPRSVDRALLENIIWVHDLPELGTGTEVPVRDIVCVVREREPQKTQGLDDYESQVALQLLSVTQMAHYMMYKEAGLALKQQRTQCRPEALIAQVIDKTDGNIMFHLLLARYVDDTASSTSEQHLPPEDALTWTFRQRAKWQVAISKLECDEEIKNFVFQLLRQQCRVHKKSVEWCSGRIRTRGYCCECRSI